MAPADTNYTRAGNFTQDTNGNLVSNGMSVMGYPAVNGVVNTNAPLQADQHSAGGPGAATAGDDDDEHDGESRQRQRRQARSFPRKVTVYDSLGEPHRGDSHV